MEMRGKCNKMDFLLTLSFICSILKQRNVCSRGMREVYYRNSSSCGGDGPDTDKVGTLLNFAFDVVGSLWHSTISILSFFSASSDSPSHSGNSEKRRCNGREKYFPFRFYVI